MIQQPAIVFLLGGAERPDPGSLFTRSMSKKQGRWFSQISTCRFPTVLQRRLLDPVGALMLLSSMQKHGNDSRRDRLFWAGGGPGLTVDVHPISRLGPSF